MSDAAATPAVAAPGPNLADPTTGIEPLRPSYRRYALTVLLILYTLNFLDRQIVTILTVPIKAELQLADWQIGAITGIAFAIFYTVLGIPIARVAERGNRPAIISIAAAVWSLFTVACGFAQNFVQMALARVGVGVGEAGCTPPAHSLITDYTPKDKRASALAYYHLGTPIGSLIGTIAGGLIADTWGWRAAFYIAGIPGLLFAAVSFFTLVEPRLKLAAQTAAKAVASPSLGEALRELRTKKTFWLLAAAASIVAFNGYGAAAFSALFFLQNHGAEATTLAAGYDMKALGFYGLTAGVTGGIAGILGSYFGGAICDWLGRSDMRWHMTVPAIAGLLSVPAYFAALLAPSYWLALLLFMIPTFLSSVWYGPVYGNVQGLVHPRTRATAAAILLFIINIIGLGLGPLSVGILSDLLSSQPGWTPGEGVRWSLVIFGCLGIVAAALFWWARNTIREDLTS